MKYTEGIFYSNRLSKFINYCFFRGRSHRIEKILYQSLFLIKFKLSCCPLYLFFEVLEKIKPSIGLRLYKRKKRKTHTVSAVPFVLSSVARYKKAISWLSTSIKMKAMHKKLSTKIFLELKDLSINNSGVAFRKKLEYYKYSIKAKSSRNFKW